MPNSRPSTVRTPLAGPAWPAVAACIAALTLATPAPASIVTQWVAIGGGEFSSDSNWDLGSPDADTVALLAMPGEQTIVVDVESTVLRLVIRAGAPVFDSDTTLTATSGLASSPSVVVADTVAGSASATVSTGTVIGTFAELGSQPGSSGALDILLGAEVAFSEVFSVGPRGAGALDVLGGSLVCRRLVAGTLAGASGTLFVDGLADGDAATGRLDAGESIVLGQKGDGALTLEHEGGAAADELVVALGPLSSGELRVDGPGTSLAIAGSADIGRNGEGSLLVLDGATATLGGTTIVGTLPDAFIFPFYPGGSGLVRVAGAGSLLAVGGALECPLGGTSQIELLSGGRITVAGDLWINRPDQSSMLFEAGPMSPTVFIAASGAALAPPESEGELTITVVLAEGHIPSAGDAYTLVEAADIDLPYSASLPNIDSALRWVLLEEIAPGPAERLVLRATIPADLDGDGEVSGADLGLLLSAWGDRGSSADLDGSGTVDGGDLGVLLAAWGPVS